MKSQVLHTVGCSISGGLQGKLEIDHSWERVNAGSSSLSYSHNTADLELNDTGISSISYYSTSFVQLGGMTCESMSYSLSAERFCRIMSKTKTVASWRPKKQKQPAIGMLVQVHLLSIWYFSFLTAQEMLFAIVGIGGLIVILLLIILIVCIRRRRTKEKMIKKKWVDPWHSDAPSPASTN